MTSVNAVGNLQPEITVVKPLVADERFSPGVSLSSMALNEQFILCAG